MSEELQSTGNTQTTENASTTPEAVAAPVAEAIGAEQPATETPAAEASKSEGEAAEVKPQGAPESYEFKAPEGVQLDDAVMSEFSTVAKELGLSQDAAQKLVETMSAKMQARTAEVQAEAFTKYRTELAGQTRADKEIGGEKFDENLGIAKKALDKFGTPELRKLLDDSGMGNHPEIIRAFYRAGKAISEDSFVPGTASPSKGEMDAATRLYGSQTK